MAFKAVNLVDESQHASGTSWQNRPISREGIKCSLPGLHPTRQALKTLIQELKVPCEILSCPLPRGASMATSQNCRVASDTGRNRPEVWFQIFQRGGIHLMGSLSSMPLKAFFFILQKHGISTEIPLFPVSTQEPREWPLVLCGHGFLLCNMKVRIV